MGLTSNVRHRNLPPPHSPQLRETDAKMEPSRNSPCPCGSGLRYKQCHGGLDDKRLEPVGAQEIPQEVLEKLRRSQLAEHRHKEGFGSVREPISMEFKGFRLAAVGKKLFWAKDWKVFPDFLNQYLRGLLKKEWGERQVALPFEEQHPIVQWRTIWTTAQQTQSRNEEGLYSAENGAAIAWFRLAYDLYLLEHNAHLQKRLLQRLREPAQFQGARFEAAVAAMMLAAGYELNFANEKLPGKHPEFVAVGKENSFRLAVEAKSRHRPGVLGFPGQRSDSVDTSDIDGLLRSALEKDTVDPLLIFIELNSPALLDQSAADVIHARLNTHWEACQSLSWPSGFPAVGVVFYNDPTPWYLEHFPNAQPPMTIAMVLWPSSSRHDFDARPFLHRVMKAVGQRLNIPHEFPAHG